MADENDLINPEELERLLQQHYPAEGRSADDQRKPAPHETSLHETSPHETSPDDSSDPAAAGPRSGSAGPGADQPKTPAASGAHSTPTSDSLRPDAGKALGQEDVDRLLGQAGTAPSAEQQEPVPGATADESPRDAQETIPQSDIECLLNQAESALDSIDSESHAPAPPGTAPFRFVEFTGAPASTENATLDLISDVELDVKIELGRTQMYLEDVLKLRKGSVVPLDKLAGDPVDIYVNGRLIARGEVLVLNDNFCVRVGELVAGLNPNG